MCWICSAADGIYVGRGEWRRELDGADPIGAFLFAFSPVWVLCGAIRLGPLDFRFLGLERRGEHVTYLYIYIYPLAFGPPRHRALPRQLVGSWGQEA